MIETFPTTPQEITVEADVFSRPPQEISRIALGAGTIALPGVIEAALLPPPSNEVPAYDAPPPSETTLPDEGTITFDESPEARNSPTFSNKFVNEAIRRGHYYDNGVLSTLTTQPDGRISSNGTSPVSPGKLKLTIRNMFAPGERRFSFTAPTKE